MNQLGGNFVTKLARDLMGFLQSRPGMDLESIDHFATLPTFDLGEAREDKRIYNRSGCRIFIISLTGTAHIRTRPAGEKYHLFKGSMSFPFKNLYLTNAPQAGKSLTLKVGLQSFVDLDREPEFIPTEPVSIHDTSTGATLSVELEVGSRKFIEIWVKSSAAATFKVYDKREGGSWHEADEIELTGAGEIKLGYWNSLPWIKVATTDANNNEIEIAAS